MRRVTKDYCSKGSHPRWKAWKPRYGKHGWAGNRCIYCGAHIPSRHCVASGGPASLVQARNRIKGLTGHVNATLAWMRDQREWRFIQQRGALLMRLYRKEMARGSNQTA